MRRSARSFLDSIDFTALSDEFKLAEAVLRERYSDAVSLMKLIGGDGAVGRVDYHMRPLFRGFRNRPEFLGAY